MKNLKNELRTYVKNNQYVLTPEQVEDCVEYAVKFMDEYHKYDGSGSFKDYDTDRNTDFAGDMIDFLMNMNSDFDEDSLAALAEEMYLIMYYGEDKFEEPEDEEEAYKRDFTDAYAKSLLIENEFMEMTEHEYFHEFMNPFMAKITLSYIYSFFSEEQLEQIVKIADCEDIEELLGCIGSEIYEISLSEASKKLLTKYPNVLDI